MHAMTANSVHADLSYLQPSASRPRSYAVEPPPGVPWENSEYARCNVPIHDARALAVPTALQCEGFALWDAPTALRDFQDQAAIQTVYYAEARELALTATGACKAYVFDHLVRRREPRDVALSFGRTARGTTAGANGRIHNDYTEASGANRLALVMPDAEQRLAVRRFAIVNIWRSIKGPVLDTPLAVCDARTLVQSELVACDVVYPRRVGEIYLLRQACAHRWFYFSRMDRHEALVFKQYDSQISGVSRFTPHAAFDHPLAPTDAPPRESIELRVLVTY